MNIRTKRRLLLALIVLALCAAAGLAVWFAIAVSSSEKTWEFREQLMVNGQLYYFSGYMTTYSEAGDESLRPEDAYELGEITTTYDDTPTEELQMNIGVNTAAWGTAYGSRDNPDAVYVYLTVDPTVDGNKFDTRQPRYVLFLSQRVYENYYIRFNGQLYSRNKDEYERVTELPDGYVEGEEVFPMADPYRIPLEEYETSWTPGKYGTIYYNPQRPRYIYLFDSIRVHPDNSKENSYSVWELQ